MKKLSSKMKEMLLFIDGVHTLGDRVPRLMTLLIEGSKVSCCRPREYANLMTHKALIRRGLTQEVDNYYHTTTLTNAGREAVKRIRELDCNG